MKKIVFALIVLLLAGCQAAIDLPTPTAGPPSPTPIVTVQGKESTPVSTVETIKQNKNTCKVSTGIESGFLNLRTGPGMNYAVIRVLEEEEVLTVIISGTWNEVIDSEGIHGFVYGKFCEV